MGLMFLEWNLSYDILLLQNMSWEKISRIDELFSAKFWVEYFCMTTISRYKYIAFFIYVTDKSCIHTFTSKYCWKYFVTDILSWQIAFTDISRLLFMLQINRVYILLQQKIDKIHAKPAT